MTLFEDRTVEAQFLHHAKSEWRAKIVPPVVTVLACAMVTVALLPAYETMTESNGMVMGAASSVFILCGGVTVGLITTACLAFSIAQICQPRLQYKLRAATFILAVTAATAAFACAATGDFLAFGPFSAIGLLWVCQKALVISDVIAARVLVVVVPINSCVLLAGVVFGVQSLAAQTDVSPEQITRTAVQLGTAVLASSGVLLWLALRHESAARTVFYWSRLVDANVETLDAEANPFHQHRLLDWMLQDAKAVEMVDLSEDAANTTRHFWELDGSLLTLEDHIASGGGGLVWKATYDGKAVAAKQLYAQSRTRQQQLQDLATEVSVLAQLSHNNIVKFLGLCRHSSGQSSQHDAYLPLFIVQEYCCTNLRAMLSQTLPSLALAEWPLEVCRIATEIAGAMQYLHGLKVLHRDLKPENVLLTGNLTVRVADFGVSLQFLDGVESAKTTSGTPEYMSPEMLCSAGAPHNSAESIDGMASDVYAFGVVVCELVHSRSNVGVLEVLAENAGINCNLEAITDDTNSDLECQWAFPPFDECVGHPVQQCVELGRNCCAFYPRHRPTFVEVCVTLDETSATTLPASQSSQQTRERWKRSRRRSSTRSSVDGTVDDEYLAFTPTPRLSAASIEINIDFEQDHHWQVGVGKCAWWCWRNHGLRFADNDAEQRFLAFLHSAEFFRYLRWPYVLLATMQLVLVLTVFATNQLEFSPYALVYTVLFGIAALCSWVPKMQQSSMLMLTVVAAVAAVVQSATVLSHAFNTDVFWLNTSTSSAVYNWTRCDCMANVIDHICLVPCFYHVSDTLFASILLPLVQGLTTPVTMLVLGLPFYLYTWLLALSFVSWTGTVFAGLSLWWNAIERSALGDFLMVVVPGVVLYPICAVTAIAGERTRRRMFLKLCSLRAQESNLVHHATLRGYREALIANWRYLEASSSAANPSKATQVVTTTTI